MILALLYALIIVFCILGLTEFIFLFKLFVITPENKSDDTIVLLLNENDYRLQIYSALKKREWYGGLYCSNIVAITENLSFSSINDCINGFSDCNIIFKEKWNL